MKVGVAFGDHIKTEKIPRRKYDHEGRLRLRTVFLVLLLIILPCILLFTLVNLQLVHGSYYRLLSDTNRTRTKIIHAPRGVIFDRNGTPLVYNIPGFREIKGDRTKIIDREKAISLIAGGKEDLEIDNLRQYPLGENMVHVLGYTGQISKEELSLPRYGTYNGTDIIGKAGLERTYEALLRGTDGKELIEVDAVGKKVRTLGQTDPIPGQDITLTIDAALQKAAYDALEPHKKAVVIASKPNGEILAMVSKPSFDPNLFTLGTTTATQSAYKSIESILMDGENQPLMNRAIAGVYPPGSTFKLVTAAAGLENNIFDGQFSVEDTGVIKVGAFSFANWFFLEQGKKDGKVNVVKAISRSNDIFFYKAAEKIKVDRLSAMASKFGVGNVAGIDLAGEEKGILPTNDWKKKAIGEPWYLGDTYHYGIGQGFLLTTPLQVNVWTNTIASGGTFYQPKLLKNREAVVKHQDFLGNTTIDLIRKGMIESCMPGGVAYPLFDFKVKNNALSIDGKNILSVLQATSSASFKEYRQVSVACKTGTAQHGGEDTPPHAWITLFAPAYDPEIVVTVLVESGGQGSSVAGPVAKGVLEAWFQKPRRN